MIEYYEDPRMSQSFLKKFLNPNPRSYFRSKDDDTLYYEKEKIYFSLGKLMDAILEDQDINKIFYIQPEGYKHPTKVVESIAQEVYDSMDFSLDSILKVVKEHNYQPKWKKETKVNWINNTLLPIVNEKISAEGKTVISQEEYDLVATMANAILSGPYTQPILEEMEGEYQVPLYTERFKGLADYLQVDRKKKVFRVIDFKTTDSYLEYFAKDILKRRYDIQLSFYTHLASIAYPDYKALNPIIIAVSKREPQYAEPFELSEKVIFEAMHGNDKRKGWLELVHIAESFDHSEFNKELSTRGTNYINEL